MRIRDNQGEAEEPINLMPLIDMVFLLLIFFLVATTITQEERELKLQLPITSKQQTLSDPPKQLIINIMQDGELRVAGQAYEWKELSDMVQRMANAPAAEQREVLIRADKESKHKYFAGVLRLCREAGLDETKVGYIAREPEAMTVQ